jgi:hypothetical protein
MLPPLPQTERGGLGRVKKVMRYMFSTNLELREECERLLRLLQADGSTVADLDAAVAALHTH